MLRVKIKNTIATATEKQRMELLESKRKISHSLDTWFQSLNDFMPSDVIQEFRLTGGGPENAALGLPSDFPLELHRRLGIEELAIIERQLRVGQVHDALKKLRTALGLKSFLICRNYSPTNDNSSRIYTRSQAEIQKATQQVEKWQEVYQHTYEALELLRGKEPIPESETAWLQLKHLRDSDCIMLSEWMEDHHLWQKSGEIQEARAGSRGKGKIELAWFWKLEFKFDGGIGGSEVQDAVDGWTGEGKDILYI